MAGTVAQTGSSGLIGSAVRKRLGATREVRTIDKQPFADFVADLSEPDSIATLDLNGCTALVHCAGIVDEDFTNTGRAFRQATQGMSALVARAKSCGVSRFVYVSSAHVYGPFAGTISESSSPNPLSDYAIAHFASEQILRRAAGPGFRAVVLRPCAVFGIPPDLARFRRWALIPFGFPHSAVEHSRIELKSSGLQRRNFVGTDDIAGAIDTWLSDSWADPFLIVNPIGKESMTVLAFAQMCARIAETVTGQSCRVVRPDAPAPLADTFEYTTMDRRFAGVTNLGDTVAHLMRLMIANGADARNT